MYNISYKYDVFGNRIEQVEDADGAGAGASVTTRFAVEGSKVMQDAWGNRQSPVGTENWNVWADLNGSNALQVRYVRGDATDELFSRVKSDGTVASYLTDRMGSVRQMVDASGAVQDTIAYDGFGNVLSESNASFGDRWKWTGREYNSYTDLQYNRARYFSDIAGLWISEDPDRYRGGDYNYTRYSLNSSIDLKDPSGLKGDDSKPPIQLPKPQGLFLPFIEIIPPKEQPKPIEVPKDKPIKEQDPITGSATQSQPKPILPVKPGELSPALKDLLERKGGPSGDVTVQGGGPNGPRIVPPIIGGFFPTPPLPSLGGGVAGLFPNLIPGTIVIVLPNGTVIIIRGGRIGKL